MGPSKAEKSNKHLDVSYGEDWGSGGYGKIACVLFF